MESPGDSKSLSLYMLFMMQTSAVSLAGSADTP